MFKDHQVPPVNANQAEETLLGCAFSDDWCSVQKHTNKHQECDTGTSCETPFIGQ